MESEFSWESEESQVPKEALEKLITSLLFAEEHQWLQSASPLQGSSSQIFCSCSCCSSSLSQDGKPSCGRCDPGYKLLRHGNSVSQIHAYFQNLEPRRYCLSLTARNKALDGPSNRVRLVRGDSRIDQRPTREEGVRSLSQHREAILSPEIPVLSAPPVPSPYSPSPSQGAVSPSSPPRARFGSSGQMSPHFEFYDSSYSPPARDYVFSPFRPSQRFTFNVEEISSDEPVQAEQLGELTRRTFGLTKRQHVSMEKSIKEKMLPKTADRVLVEDLLTQLSLLHKNFHPYYRIQSFLDKNGYDQWVEAEKDHINRLVKRFWNSPLPSVNECYPIHVYDAHEGYRNLLSKLIREESLNKSSTHSVFGDTTPTSPLSPASGRLLKEFGLRYGVGKLYRRLVYLQYLVNHFECELWYIKHVTNLLEIVMRLVTSTPEIYVKEEFLMCIHILSLLFRLSKYYLTRVTRLFQQNSPPGGVASLVSMAAMVQEAAHFLKSTFPAIFMNVREAREFVETMNEEPFEIQLASYLKEEIRGRYERFKVIAIDDLDLNHYENPMSPQLLNILILNIRDEITTYKTYYQEEFQRFLDFVQLATVTFYGLLMEDVSAMRQLIPFNAPTDEVDLRMLSLAFRLSILDKDNTKYLRIGMQTWREPFLQLSLIWMDVVGRHLEELVPVLLQRDQWHVTSVTLEDSGDSRPASTLRRMPRIQYITRSDRSAFTPVRSASESDLRGRKAQQEEVSGSNPHLSSLADQMSLDESSSSSVSSSSWRPVRMTASPPPKTGFKGKTIITEAQIHRPDVKDSDSDKTEDIGDMSFEGQKESSLEQTQRIENIDQDDSNDLPHVICLAHGKTSQQNEPALTGLTGQNDKRRATPYENADEKEVNEGSSLTTGSSGDSSSYDTARGSLLERTGPLTEDERETKEDESILSVSEQSVLTQMTEKLTDSVEDTLDQSFRDATITSVDDTPDTPALYSVEGAQGVPTPNVQGVPTPNGQGVPTPNVQGVPTPNVQGVPTPNVQGVPTPNVQGVPTPNVQGVPTPNVQGVPTPNVQGVPTPNVQGVPTPNVQGVPTPNGQGVPTPNGQGVPTPNVQGVPTPNGKEIIVTNANVAKWNSIMGTENALAQQHEASKLKDKTSCQDCPNKVVTMPTDIEQIVGPPGMRAGKTTNHQRSDAPWDQPSGQPGPVSIMTSQSFVVPPKNKLLSRAIAAEKASLSSGPTEYGSCPTSYATARDSSENTSNDVSSEYESASSSTDYGSCSDSDSEPPPAPQLPTIVPVSSSLVDLLCCVQRLTSFACHLCKVLCPTERVIPGRNEGYLGMEDNKARVMEIKTALCGKLIKIVKRIVTLYVDDILAIETCGMSEEDMASVIGQNITRHLIGRYRSGEVIGCRFNPGRREKCNTRNNAGKKVKPCPALRKIKEIPTGCELTTDKMGLRSSDVIILQSLLSWLHDRLTTAISRLDSMPGFHGEFDRQSILSESYCQNGPTLDGSSQGFQQDSRRHGEDEHLRLAQSLDVSLDECSADLEGNLTAQDKLLAYRVNEIFKKILHELLSLSLPAFSVRRRLQPAVDFLRRRLTLMRRVMFPDRFAMLIRRLWRHIVQDFEEEIEHLKERRLDASEHAGLLLMSLAHLMQCFHNQKQGLASEELNVTTETVCKHIELYTSPTPRLIRLYQWLRQQMLSLEQEQIADEFTSSVSTSSHHSGIQSPADHLIETLRSELHATNKCFSGAAFVEWVINYVQINGYDSLGVCIGINDTETAMELGQYLMEKNQLVCVRNTEQTQSMGPDEEEDVEQAASPLERQRMPRSSRGALVMDEASLPKMTVNKISVNKHNSSGSHPDSSQSTSHYSTETSDLSDSDEESDTQGLLDSVDVILRQARSTQSLAVLFHNSPNVFYSFISDEEGSGGERKYRLAFIDRFSVGVKLQHIVRALYTRKGDETARFFLRRLPINEVVHALGYKETPICFSI